MSPIPTHSSAPVIELRDISLCYRLANHKVRSFKEFMISAMRGGLSYSDLWALRDIDLSVERGEILGIVGRNGAGKSTLSKVIAGVLRPTTGTVEIRGRISPVLELGTGFDMELTGHENIYLNALLRGHRRTEVDEVIDDIVEFSGVSEFIHSPVRNYSTGMVARLGFAVATAWQPDVLVLDEVLAVGDAKFLGRCHEKIEAFRDAGTTILIVSHSSQAILERCTRCIWLDKGLVQADGETKDVVRAYSQAAGDEQTMAVIDAMNVEALA